MAENAKLVLTAEDQTRAAFEAVKQSMGSVISQSSALKASLLGIGASLGVGVLVGQFRDVVRSAASLDDLAAKTGASVQSLGLLRAQAKINGADFEGLTDVLVKFSRALSGADDESKAAGAALARLGLNAEDLRKLDPADALKAVVRELNGYADSGGKAALASDLLGKNTAQYLPVLKDWANNSQLTAKVTAEQAHEAKELDKQLNMLSLSYEANKKSMLLGMVPALLELTTQFNEARKAAGGFWQGLVLLASAPPADAGGSVAELSKKLETLKETQKGLSGGGLLGSIKPFLNAEDIAIVNAQIGIISKQLTLAQATQKRLAFRAGEGLGEEDSFGAAPLKSLKDYTRPAKPEKDGGSASSPYDAAIKGLENEITKAAQLGREFEILDGISKGHYGGLNEAQKRALTNAAKLVDANRELIKGEKEAEKAAADTRTATAAMSDEVARMKKQAEGWRGLTDPMIEQNKHIAEGLRLLGNYQISIAELNKGADPRLFKLLNPEKTDSQFLGDRLKEGDINLGQYKEAVARLNGELKNTKSIQDEVFSKLSSGFEEAVTSGKKFGDVMRQLGLDLLKLFVRNQITEPLAGAAKNLFSGIDFGGIFKNLFGFAGGGDFTVGGGGGTDSQLVAFRATPGESVSVRTPGQQAGGGTVVINQSMSFGSDVNRATLLAWGEQVKQQTVAAVADLRTRGGSFSMAMGR